VAINPHNSDEVPAIADIASYREIMFAHQYVDGAPSFYDYLENMRKIPRSHFSDQAWDILSLNSEMMAYNMMLRGIVERRMHEQKQRQAETGQAEQLAHASVEDLMASRVYVQSQLERIDSELARASQERADQPPA